MASTAATSWPQTASASDPIAPCRDDPDIRRLGSRLFKNRSQFVAAVLLFSLVFLDSNAESFENSQNFCQRYLSRLFLDFFGQAAALVAGRGRESFSVTVTNVTSLLQFKDVSL